ncbi:MAG: thiamine-phosphate kinase [bacterium]|nr:thiamine-phosphate kinase [bacterium]
MLQLYGGHMHTRGGPPTLVKDLTEEELIARFAPLLPQGGALVPTGDDAAVLALADPRVVVTTDALVEGAHFRREWSSGADVGWRAIMQNAPDVAAMGATPVGFVVSLVVPGDLEADWVVGLAEGMAEACREVSSRTGRPCGVVGGDLAGGPAVVVAVTAFGDLGAAAPVLRSGARPGDTVAHVGTLGRSAAGLALLLSGDDDAARLPSSGGSAVGTYLRPQPPLEAALAAAGAASAMMDVSDGLVRDGGRIARASGVRLELSSEGLVDEVVSEVAERLGADPLAWVLGGGEDHGFLATFPRGVELPAGFRVIGRVAEGAGVLVDAAPPPVAGWDHFGGGS